ncbi:MAG: VWA domain-containing protein, partial [Pseudomonadota bacterium]
IASRRTRPDARGRKADWRATLRASMRTGGDVRGFAMRDRAVRWPNLVALCDISGSMSGYSRMLLHFLHAAANAKGAGWAQVHAFTFGTRLTNITRNLRRRDVDAALEACGREAMDWEGGTRIGECLHEFNRDWSRRVLGQGAVVLLITDGLDRDDPERLRAAAERLQLSARKVIWLNPLLRWDGFAPKAQGVRALLPHVDSFRASHSIASLTDLAEALSRPDDAGEKGRLMRMMDAGEAPPAPTPGEALVRTGNRDPRLPG